MTKMMYSLSIGMPPTAVSSTRPLPALVEQALHLLGELLLRRQQPPLEDVLDLRQLLAAGEFAADGLEISAQARNVRLVLGELFAARLQAALEHQGLAPDFEQLRLEGGDAAVEVLPGVLDSPRFSDLGQHQQQHDGAEAAADHVEKRQ